MLGQKATCSQEPLVSQDWEVRGTEDVGKLRRLVSRFGRGSRMGGRDRDRDRETHCLWGGPWFPPHLGDPPGGLMQISPWIPVSGPLFPSTEELVHISVAEP